MLIYCALNAAFVLLGLALCGAGFFGSGSFGVRALAWLLSLEAGFLGAFGAVYFSFRAYRNKIEDELRAGKYDEILRQSPKNSAGFISGETSACDMNSASFDGENRGGVSGDEISYSEVYGDEILKRESFRGENSGDEISNAQNSEDAVNFTSSETRVENGDSCVTHDETAAGCAANSAADINFTRSSILDAECDKIATGERDINSTKSSLNETSAYDATALGRAAADKFNMKDCATCDNSHGGINDEASDSSQGDIGARCDDLKSGAGSNLDDDVDSGALGDGTDSGNRGGDVDSGEPDDGMSDFEGGIGTARDKSKDDFEGVDDFEGEPEWSEVRSNFAGAFFSPFKILSYAALVAAIYLLAKLSLLNPLAIILGVTIIPLGTMIVAFGGKEAR